MNTAIVWLRRDLRLEDNPALYAAVMRHDEVLPLYIHAPEEEAPWEPGAASRWWLHHSLAALDASLRERGAALHLARGPSLRVLEALVEASGAQAVYWNRCYEPALLARDRDIKQHLRARGIEAHSFNSALLFEPWEVMTAQDTPYRVFTPFWRNAMARLETAADCLPAPAHVAMPGLQGALPLDALGLLPRIRWDTGMGEHWRPGAQGAALQLARFIEHALRGYSERRDYPAESGTSRLSPHLHFGEIGPRQVLAALAGHVGNHRVCCASATVAPYVRELGWREFSAHLLFHFPQTPAQNLNPAFERFPWADADAELLARWQRGHTGIPVVDAGMRELWHTGWMHNRVRMLVASLLTKNLRMHWLNGARWFWDTLVDADLANNTQGWQWTAGTGADAAPYFRIFSPLAQSAKFDPRGDYIRRWVPELAGVPLPRLFEPWKDTALLARTGYPAPVVDLAASRAEALSAYQSMRARRGTAGA